MTQTDPAEARFRILVDGFSDPIVMVDCSLITRYANQAFFTVLGYLSKEVIGQPFEQFLAEEDRDAILKDLSCQEEEPDIHFGFACRLRRKDSGLEDAEVSVTALSDPAGQKMFILHCRIVTSQKKTENELYESQLRYLAVLDNMLEGVQIIGHDWRYLYLNDAVEKQSHRPKSELLGRVFQEIWPGIETTRLFEEMQRCMEERISIKYENFFEYPDGETGWFDLSIQPTPEGILILSIDVSDQKRINQALQVSEERYRALAQSLDSIVVLVDPEGRVMYVNDVAASYLGITPEDLNRRPLMDILPPQVSDMLLTEVRRVIRDDKPLFTEEKISLQDSPRWFRVSIQPIHDLNETVMYVQVNLTDINDLKEAQHELLELNRTLEDRVQLRTDQVRDLYENAPTGYHSLDPEGKIVQINQTEMDWLGYTKEEMIGKSFLSFLTEESQRSFQRNFPRFKEQGYIRDLEFDLLRRDGSTMPVLVSATAIKDENGKMVMSRTTVFDNTDRREAEDALRDNQETLQYFFDTASDLIQRINEKGEYLYVNNAWLNTLGYGVEDIPKITMFDVLAPPFHKKGRGIMERIMSTGQPQHVEVILMTKTGEEVHAEGSVSGRKEKGGRYSFNGIFRNVTLRKQAEQALRQSRDELRAANAALEKAARTKDEFLASMSHELRTPLTGILGLSEALQLETYGEMNAKQRNAIKNIEESGRHLLELINDILDLSKLDAGKLEIQFEPCVLSEICQASLHLAKGMAHKKNQKVRFSSTLATAVLYADPRRLKQMLVNLLSNAIKFTPEGGSLGLEVDGSEEDQQVRITVWDHGIGISQKDLPRLFQRFEQLDSSLSRHHTGTGLGLALVQRMTELHGGSLEVESTPGQGSRFTILLPWDPETELAPAKTRPVSWIPRSLTIEDNPIDTDQITRYLKELGIVNIELATGQNAVEIAAQTQPYVILLDLNLPDRYGFEVLEELKQDERTNSIPVIIISVEERKSEARNLGAAGYLVKPVRIDDLRAEMVNVMEQAGEERRVVLVNGIQKKPLILLADDTESALLFLSDYLESQRYQVITARNGAEALQALSDQHPEVIVMDIQMPGMDGLEAIRRIRSFADAALAKTPIIAVTALAMPGDRERCLEAGADEYLAKPVHLPVIIDLIQKLRSRE